MRDNLGARPKRRHLAIADVRQAGDRDDLADLSDLRQIQRIVSRVARHDRRRQWQSERIEHGHRALQLRQIRPIILAGAELEQPFGCDEGRDRRAINARHARLEVVDAYHVLIERARKLSPVLCHAQVIEHRCQPIIGAIAWLDPSAEAPTERALMFFDPRRNVREPVVALGEDEGQLDNRHPSETQSRPIAVSREVVVQQFGHAHLLELRDDDRYIVYAFVGCCDLLAHPTSLSQFLFSRDHSREM